MQGDVNGGRKILKAAEVKWKDVPEVMRKVRLSIQGRIVES